MIDPNTMPPAMRQQLMMGPNGQMMRPPSSHPNLSAQQMELMRQGSMQMPNGQFPPGQQPPGAMMPGQQPGQPVQGPQGTPRQANNMPPPPAPQANAGGTQPSSPSQQPAPPTPSTTNKSKTAAKKETAKKVSCDHILSRLITTNAAIGCCRKEGRERCERHPCIRVGTSAHTYTCNTDHAYEPELFQQEPRRPANAKRRSGTRSGT
jgi:hypothetical protein